MSEGSVNGVLIRKLMRNGTPPRRGSIADARLGSARTRWKRIRQWDKVGRSDALLLPWICLNPAGNEVAQSAESIQPFKTRGTGWNMIALSWRWGFDGCIACNVFPFEDKDPDSIAGWLGSSTQELLREANSKIATDLLAYDAAVSAWGQNRHAKRHVVGLLNLVSSERDETHNDVALWRLKMNADGSPRHPGQGTRHDWLPEHYAIL